MLSDPIVLPVADSSPSVSAGASTSFARTRLNGLMAEYVATTGVASPTQPMYLRVTQKKRPFGVLGVVAKYRAELEYHIDVPAVNGVPQADRPVKFAWEFEGNTIDLTQLNKNRLLNVAVGLEFTFSGALSSGQI